MLDWESSGQRRQGKLQLNGGVCSFPPGQPGMQILILAGAGLCGSQAELSLNQLLLDRVGNLQKSWQEKTVHSGGLWSRGGSSAGP